MRAFVPRIAASSTVGNAAALDFVVVGLRLLLTLADEQSSSGLLLVEKIALQFYVLLTGFIRSSLFRCCLLTFVEYVFSFAGQSRRADFVTTQRTRQVKPV